ncbi:MAG: cysteine--tRNA ligase [Elusimicrobiota bacterium]|jgi:cysteinyl-tRNA synthetase|nr:cysteine--tRNA ligase [Elusimicrobiota bacterium]
MIMVYNTFSDTKVEFKPLKNNEVSMYVCGVTPYDNVHLGHARAYTAFDVIKRHLIKRGYKVNHIQNFTDVDDKIINKAVEQKISVKELSQIYIDDYFVEMDKLNILRADVYPLVTNSISEIIDFIAVLVDKGFAYQTGGDVYFNVEKFKDYGKLSKRKLSDLKAGARVEINDEKLSPVDFALWKGAKESDPSDASWDSPWGKGRPGWHIECSVMSSKYLGDEIDIHGGGADLLFPHHENEIAQSEAKSGKQFVKYWIHNGFVTINKEKMSKSKDNFFTLKDIFNQYNPRIIRYYLMTQHYKSPLDFSYANIDAAKNALQGIDDAYLRLSALSKSLPLKDEALIKVRENFLAALDDDFNCEKALSYLHEAKNLILNEIIAQNTDRLGQLKTLFEELAESSLGIVLPSQGKSEDVQGLLDDRNKARKNKNWAEADRLRKLIDEKGYKITDNPDGSSVLTKKI